MSENLSAHRRPHLKLIKGWFKDTLPSPEAQAIKEVAYAKIDCDLYEPSVEILDFLRGRMTHGSVMVFDDWTHVLFAGETKAFVTNRLAPPFCRSDLRLRRYCRR